MHKHLCYAEVRGQLGVSVFPFYMWVQDPHGSQWSEVSFPSEPSHWLITPTHRELSEALRDLKVLLFLLQFFNFLTLLYSASAFSDSQISVNVIFLL